MTHLKGPQSKENSQGAPACDLSTQTSTQARPKKPSEVRQVWGLMSKGPFANNVTLDYLFRVLGAYIFSFTK